MKKTLKKILHIAVDVLIVCILIVSVLILTMVLTSRGSGKVPSVFGKAPISVLTDSMKGNNEDNFNSGDLIICDVVEYPLDSEYKEGDVVTFAQDINGDGEKELITHRIYKDLGEKQYLTKGDNNDTYDQDESNAVVFPPLNASKVLAVYHGQKIPGLGGVLNYLQTPLGFFLVILLPMIIFFIYQAIRVVLNAMAYSKEKGAEQARKALDNSGLTEEQKAQAIAEYLATQNKSDGQAQNEAPADNAPPETPEPAAEDAPSE